MLDDFPRDSQHVRWLPCKDVLILVPEVNKCAFLFAREGHHDARLLGWVVLINLDFLGLLSRLECRGGDAFVGVGGTRGEVLLDLRQINFCDDLGGELAAVLVTLLCVQEVRTNYDDALWFRHI